MDVNRLYDKSIQIKKLCLKLKILLKYQGNSLYIKI